MAWITTKDGRRVNTEWFDKELQLNENGVEAAKKNAEDKLNGLRDKGFGQVETPIALVSKSDGYAVQDIWNKLKAKERKQLPEETVKVSDLKTWQTWVSKGGVQRILDGKNEEHQGKKAPPIYAVYHNGNYVLTDGNHRVAAGMLMGQNEFKVKVYKGGN